MSPGNVMILRTVRSFVSNVLQAGTSVSERNERDRTNGCGLLITRAVFHPMISLHHSHVTGHQYKRSG
jgi:hypothetical protein